MSEKEPIMVDVEELAEELATVVAAGIKLHTAPLVARVAALEQRAGLGGAAKPRVTHRGVWEASREYRQDDAAVYQGRLWRCLVESIRGAEPTAGSTFWRGVS